MRHHIRSIAGIMLAMLLLTAVFPAAALESSNTANDPILAAFPKITKVEKTDGGQFAFRGAPVTNKTQYTINEKTDECIVLHQFASAADAITCFSMIRGYGLEYNGAFVYANTVQPYTYYIDNDKRLLLYCGSNASVHKKLTALRFYPRGGYFAQRSSTISDSGESYQWEGSSFSAPGSLKNVLKASHRILYCKVEAAAPVKDTMVRYRLATLQNIKNAEEAHYNIYALTGALSVGKTYILFLKQSIAQDSTLLAAEDRGVYTTSADGMPMPGLEVNGQFVLPAMEYGMKAQCTLEDFTAQIAKNRYFKKVAVPEDVQRAYRGVEASDTAGNMRLDLILPKTTVKAGEPIECYTELTYTGKNKQMTIYSDGKPYFTVVGGPYLNGEWISMLDIVKDILMRGVAKRFTFSKSGVYDPDGVNGAFFERYFNDPVLRLDPGEYEIITGFRYSLNEDFNKVYRMEARTMITVE